MKFEKVIESFGTVLALRRFASAYVVDHTKLNEEETIAALKKTAPQYFHEPNVRKAVEECLMNPDREMRTIAPILLGEVLLNCDQFTSAEKDTDDAVIDWEKAIIDNSNEAILSKKSSDPKRWILSSLWSRWLGKVMIRFRWMKRT